MFAYLGAVEMKVKQMWGLVKQSVSSWSEDYAPSMGAALSYYTLFSITPLLLIVISVAGLVFGADAVRGVVIAQLQSLMGEESARAIKEMLSTASEPSTGGIAATVSVIGLLIGATTVFNELQSDLDRIWRVPARVKTSGLWTLLRTRLLSFGMVLGVIFLLTVSLVTSAALSTLGKWWGAWFGGWELLAHVLDIVVNFGLLTLVFALIYKMIPRVHVGWHDVWTGAAVTAILFTIGKVLIGLYLGKSDITSNFGAAGSFVIMMVWVYYSTQIFLFGAEFTWVYANNYGSRRHEAKNVDNAQREEQTVPTRSDSAGPKPSVARERLPSTTSAVPTGAAPFSASAEQAPAVRSPTHPAASASIEPRVSAATRPVASARTLDVKSVLRDKRVALGLAIATGIAVAIAARMGALKGALRAVTPRRRPTTAPRRLAS